ncbi:MAG: class II aldolase/adducin family protein [Acidimicrobiales bacterium]
MGAPDMGEDGDARALVTLASKVLAAAGQSDLIWGHVSVRDPGGRGAWLKAAGWGLEEIDEDRVVLVDPDGEVVEGDGPRHVECFIHTRVMAARHDVGCVVHTHAGASTAFASLGVPLRPISHEGALFVPPDVARFTGTSSLIRSADLGDQLAKELGDRNALLLPGHGVVVVGCDVPTAVMTAVLLDRACRLQLDVTAAGGPHVWTADDEALEKRAMCWPPLQLESGWRYLVRRATGAEETAGGPSAA